ncbi:questin oxidase family protein [Acrocarpospora macrocephala]|uniref:DUF4243 domain-containing protein n=1 Tax=Acrocarpospora macrocephala TaxID=150177 RepID=A0A5M3XCT4_9ACTN|nr:questin oxidase family protein [Acrocarpospora macrocephala]GES15868.1 hypothetical protein Amac_094660 [Acrocarpospora macrocephala]
MDIAEGHVADRHEPPDRLLDALDRLRGTGVEFAGFLANHGPMAAEALIAMGAGDVVPDWVDAYRAKLEPEPPAGRPIKADEWRSATGDMRRLGDWVATFRRELGEAPWRQVLVTWWPRLLPGMAASATHGVIRTAHIVRVLSAAGDPPPWPLVDEFAHGLAFWAARYQPLPGSPALNGAFGPADSIARLPRMDSAEPSSGAGIGGRLAALVRVPRFAEGLDAYGAPADPDVALDRLIAAAARVLWTRPDAPIAFCHAVTAPAAARLVLPSLPVELHRPTIAASWQIIGAIITAFAADAAGDGLYREDPPDTPDRAVLLRRAVEHGDEHVIKLTEAALREYSRTRDPVLLHAAEAFVKRMPR